MLPQTAGEQILEEAKVTVLHQFMNDPSAVWKYGYWAKSHTYCSEFDNY